MNRQNILALLIGLIVTLTVVSLLLTTFTAAGDDICEHAAGPGAEYLEGQPMWDSQLDCVAPNGTVLRDVDVPPMNVSSTETGLVTLLYHSPTALS